jgi:hypothetical protein
MAEGTGVHEEGDTCKTAAHKTKEMVKTLASS